MKEIYPILFGLLITSVLIWFVLCNKLFKLLEANHFQKYVAMGKPSLIMNNSLSNNISFMKYLYKREYLNLNDPAVSKLSQSMRAFLILYLILFLFLFLGVPLGYAP